MKSKIQELQQLYAKASKHSNYQILSTRLSSILPPEEIEIQSRYENERLDYLLKKIVIEDKTALDVGANTGFFSFELLEHGLRHIHYYEGNKDHADFVRIAAGVLEVADKIKITNSYLSFNDELTIAYDIILLFNVLHHVGEDYGNESLTIKGAKEQILAQLLSLHGTADIIIFQLGFNWKGNRNLGLFENGTKKEMIDFVTSGVKGMFSIDSIGIAERKNGNIVYKDLSEKNIERDDSLGEFLNRPLFILKSV